MTPCTSRSALFICIYLKLLLILGGALLLLLPLCIVLFAFKPRVLPLAPSRVHPPDIAQVRVSSGVATTFANSSTRKARNKRCAISSEMHCKSLI